MVAAPNEPDRNVHNRCVRSDFKFQRIRYRTSRRKQDGSFVHNGQMTRHHPSEPIIELFEFFIDACRGGVKGAALPGRPGIGTRGAMVCIGVAHRGTVRVGGQLTSAEFCIDVESLVIRIPAADPATYHGQVVAVNGGAVGFIVVARRITVRVRGRARGL